VHSSAHRGVQLAIERAFEQRTAAQRKAEEFNLSAQCTPDASRIVNEFEVGARARARVSVRVCARARVCVVLLG
jgi:hypothetical protein